MEEAPEDSKESSHSAHANGMNEMSEYTVKETHGTRAVSYNTV